MRWEATRPNQTFNADALVRNFYLAVAGGDALANWLVRLH